MATAMATMATTTLTSLTYVHVLFLLCAPFTLVHANTVWPMPLDLSSNQLANTLLSSTVSVSPSFQFYTEGPTNEYVQAAARRALKIITHTQSSRHTHVLKRASEGELASCSLRIQDASTELTQQTSEQYTLDVDAQTLSCSIVGETYVGAVHALESFVQLVDTYTMTINATSIKDKPRYAFRALLVDTSRHFYPVETLLTNLDAMAMTKMNIMHWHIVDSNSFPYVSSTFPEMSKQGAWAPHHVYSHEDVATVIEYAKARGIRVMVEFDTPGHVDAGYAAIPGILTQCYDKTTGQPDGTTGPLDPTNESTYDFLEKLYTEIKAVFPDKYVHVGGDEVPFGCWESNPSIAKWMAAHPNVTDAAKLEQYYELRLLDILKRLGFSYMCWQEIFDNGVQILPDTIVNVWKGGSDDTALKKELQAVTGAGYRAVLSAPWYLDYISYGEDWKKYYIVEPDNLCDNCELFGVEACMWSEYVDATNFISRTWPRTGTLAERAWSPKNVNDVDAASPRLNELRCKMILRGIRAEPIHPSFCLTEWPGDAEAETVRASIRRAGLDMRAES